MADKKQPLAALLKKAADKKSGPPSRSSLQDSGHDQLSYQHLAVEKQTLQYNQPTAQQFVRDAETRLMIEAVNKKLSLLYKEIESVETKEAEDEKELDQIEEEIKSETDRAKKTQKSLSDATKSVDRLTPYVVNITENIQNIADKMGAYVTTLKETREALQDEREATAPKEAAAPEKMSLGEFFGSMKNIENRGGILGVLGMGLMKGAGKSLMKNVGKPVAAAAGSAAKNSASAIMKLMKNPKVLMLAAVAAIGVGVYKYFTDDKFKESVVSFFSKAMDMGKEYILEPIMNMFGAMKEGMFNLVASIFETYASISIPVPEFLQKLGLPASIEPYGFLKGAAQDLRQAAKDSKSERDEMNSARAAKNATAAAAESGGASATRTSASGGAAPSAGGGGAPQATPAAGGGGASIGGGYMAVAAKFIADHEGFPKGGKAFWDPPGQNQLVSVGFGHQIQPHEYQQGFIQAGNEQIPIKGERGIDTVLTKEQATALLAMDMPKYEKRAAAPLGEAWSKLSDNQKAALISYAYNTGSTASLVKQGLKDAIMSGDMKTAASIIADKGVRTAGGKVLGGLVKRRAEEAALFASTAVNPTTNPTIAGAGREDDPIPGPAATPAGKAAAASDASLAKPVSGGGQSSGQAAGSSPTTGESIAAASTAVNDLKLKCDDKDTTVVDASKNNQTQASAIMSASSIPSPVANRGTIDRFNFFDPPGMMKLA